MLRVNYRSVIDLVNNMIIENPCQRIVLIRMNYADECCGDVADVSNRLN